MADRVLRRGVVVDAGGNPVDDAFVSIVWATVAMPDVARRTDATGGFQVGLPPGRFRLEAVAGERVGQVEVDGGEGAVIVIQVAPP